jgi:hypothetical protein
VADGAVRRAEIPAYRPGATGFLTAQRLLVLQAVPDLTLT